MIYNTVYNTYYNSSIDGKTNSSQFHELYFEYEAYDAAFYQVQSCQTPIYFDLETILVFLCDSPIYLIFVLIIMISFCSEIEILQ